MKRSFSVALASDKVYSEQIDKNPTHRGLTSHNSSSSLQSGRTSVETGLSSRGSEESLHEDEWTKKHTVTTVISQKTCEEIVTQRTSRMDNAFKPIAEEDHTESNPARKAATSSREKEQYRGVVVSPIASRGPFMDLASLAESLPERSDKKYCR